MGWSHNRLTQEALAKLISCPVNASLEESEVNVRLAERALNFDVSLWFLFLSTQTEDVSFHPQQEKKNK